MKCGSKKLKNTIKWIGKEFVFIKLVTNNFSY